MTTQFNASQTDQGFGILGMAATDILLEITFDAYSGPTNLSRTILSGQWDEAGGGDGYIYQLPSSNDMTSSGISDIRLDGATITTFAPADVTGGNVFSCIVSGHGGDLVVANRYSLTEPIICSISAVTVKTSDGLTTLHTFDLSSPSSTSVTDTTGSATGTLLNFTFGPTITDVNTDESVYPGESFVITGAGFGSTQGTGGVDVDGVAYTVTAWSDTSITCTSARGGNNYGTGKALTVTTDAATTATSTVAQEAEPGTFAVTAASPNTTDDASLWTGLVDTVTSNPITIVNGDQAWVKNPNNLTNLAIAADGAITADTEGDFVVQIWLASEGVWGSDQTVTFEVPATSSEISVISAAKKKTRRRLNAYLMARGWRSGVPLRSDDE